MRNADGSTRRTSMLIMNNEFFVPLVPFVRFVVHMSLVLSPEC